LAADPHIGEVGIGVNVQTIDGQIILRAVDAQDAVLPARKLAFRRCEQRTEVALAQRALELSAVVSTLMDGRLDRGNELDALADVGAERRPHALYQLPGVAACAGKHRHAQLAEAAALLRAQPHAGRAHEQSNEQRAPAHDAPTPATMIFASWRA
jgi:hypothetical protein